MIGSLEVAYVSTTNFIWPSILRRKTRPDEASLLWDSSVFFFGLGIPILLGLAFLDPTEVNSEPRWIKPLKFFISIAVYNFTLEWIYRVFQTDQTINLLNKARWTIGIGLLLEGTLITVQATRGVQSHFNNTTSLDTAIFGIMGFTITIVVLTALLSGYVVWKQRLHAPRMVVEAVLFGILIMTLGSFQGFSMTAATEAQQALIEQGQQFLTIGSHFVGIPPAENHQQLAFTGWSLEVGNLRIAHFIGLHGIQFLLMLALVLQSLKVQSGVAVVRLSAFLYSGFFLYAFLQARNGVFLV